MSDNHDASPIEKPKTIRTIFILHALKIVLALGFFLTFTFTDVSVAGITPSILLYTLAGYVVAFGAIVVSILKRNAWALRAAILLDLIISLPAKAYIGIVIASVSLLLTFTRSARRYCGEIDGVGAAA